MQFFHFISIMEESLRLINIYRVRLMCALRAHIKLSICGNIFSRIEKVITTFSIPEKIFTQIEILMCALRAHISKIHIYIPNFNHLSIIIYYKYIY